MNAKSVLVFVLLILVGCASIVLLIAAGVSPILVVLVMVAGVVVFGLVVPRRFGKKDELAIKEDLRHTCKPLLKRYQKSSSARELYEEYLVWAEGDHVDDVRVIFTQTVANILVGAGMEKRARHVLADGLEAAQRRGLEKDYQQFIDVCEKNIRSEGEA